MGNRNLKEIAVLRSIVMLMVITIHFLNLPHVCLQMGSYGQGFYVIWRAILFYVFEYDDGVIPCQRKRRL